MARKRRIELAGTLYHVLARGNQRQKIFRSKRDFVRYLDFLAQYKERYRFFLFAYVLMPNHVHLLVETAQVPLSKILQGLNQSYTMYFNRKYETVGHLFQGRYKAIICDRDEYLLTLIKYIHLNPVRAAAAQRPDDYPWSSHHAYAMKLTNNELIDTDHVLRMFAEHRPTAIQRYLGFINAGPAIDRKDIYGTVDQHLLGDEQFVSDVRSKAPIEIKGSRRRWTHSLEDISEAIMKVYAVSIEEMRAQTKSTAVAEGRRIFCQVARELAYRNRDLAVYLRKDPASVTRYFKEEANLAAAVKKILDSLDG